MGTKLEKILEVDDENSELDICSVGLSNLHVSNDIVTSLLKNKTKQKCLEKCVSGKLSIAILGIISNITYQNCNL